MHSAPAVIVKCEQWKCYISISKFFFYYVVALDDARQRIITLQLESDQKLSALQREGEQKVSALQRESDQKVSALQRHTQQQAEGNFLCYSFTSPLL